MAALALWTMAILFGTHLPPGSVSLPVRDLDKVVHMAAYAIWGGLAGLAFLPRPRGIVVLLAAGLTLGALDEVSQLLVGRDADLLDLLADLSGVVVGLALARLFRR